MDQNTCQLHHTMGDIFLAPAFFFSKWRVSVLLATTFGMCSRAVCYTATFSCTTMLLWSSRAVSLESNSVWVIF
jgi:hypothetical protein